MSSATLENAAPEAAVATRQKADRLDADLARQLQQETAGVKFRRSAFGVNRTLTRAQVAKAAEAFGAKASFLRAGKKLIDTRHKTYQKVIGIQYRASQHVKSVTLPYPESGKRLLRRDQTEAFQERLQAFKQELQEALGELQQAYENEMLPAAESELGVLYNASDYPRNIASTFDIDWEFTNEAPPEYLKRLNPALYEAQAVRVAARFEEAMAMAEDAFAVELQKLVEHLADCISPKFVQLFCKPPADLAAAERLAEIEERLLQIEESQDIELLLQAGALEGEQSDLKQAAELRLAKEFYLDGETLFWKAEETHGRIPFSSEEDARAWLAKIGCRPAGSKPLQKRFNDSAISGLTGFFDRFKSLNVGSNAQLDKLVDQAESLLQGVTPAELRRKEEARETLGQGLAKLRENIDLMMIDRPGRPVNLNDEDDE